jgi:2-oxoglutarate ferredoxin oxidoreductase subunit alpha
MVAMNPQTWDRDRPRSRRALTCSTTPPSRYPFSRFRDDITVVGVPLTAVVQRGLRASARTPAVQEHHLRRALAALIGIEPEAIESLIAEDFAGRDRLIKANFEAFWPWATTMSAPT